MTRRKMEAAGSPPPPLDLFLRYFQPVVASFEKPVGAAESSAGQVAFLPYQVPACAPAVMSTRKNFEPDLESDSKHTPPAVSVPTFTRVGSTPRVEASACEKSKLVSIALRFAAVAVYAWLST